MSDKKQYRDGIHGQRWFFLFALLFTSVVPQAGCNDGSPGGSAKREENSLAAILPQMPPEEIQAAIAYGQQKEPKELEKYDLFKSFSLGEGRSVAIEADTNFLKVAHSAAMAKRKYLPFGEKEAREMLKDSSWDNADIFVLVYWEDKKFSIEHVVLAKTGSEKPEEVLQPIDVPVKPDPYSDNQGLMAIYPLKALREGWEFRVILGDGTVLKAPLTDKALKGIR